MSFFAKISAHSAEVRCRLLHRVVNLVLETDIDHERQCFPACCLDFRGGCVNGTGQFGMRRVGLGGDHDVGSIASRAQCDGKADAAARAGDKQRLAAQGCSSIFGQFWPPKLPARIANVFIGSCIMRSGVQVEF